MDQYVAEVLKFRKALNLTSVADVSVFNQKFIRPTLAMAQWVPDGGRMLDIGSGMGVPGVPLLIAKPDLIGVLVERRKKRAEFLRHVSRRLGLKTEIYDEDVNALQSLKVNVCVARAVTDECSLLKMCRTHVSAGAVAVLPIASTHPPAKLDDWVLEHEQSVSIGVNGVHQLVRCYRYG